MSDLLPPLPPIAEIVQGNRVVGVREKRDGSDSWVVLTFETGHSIHIMQPVVIVHPVVS